MTRFIANIKRFVKRNNSTILSVIGSGGVIATTILAIRATPKACELIKADSRFNHDGDPYAYTKLEAIQSAWKCYIPTAISCIGTIVCIFGSDAISRNNKEALIGAYTLLSNSYEEYLSLVILLIFYSKDVVSRSFFVLRKRPRYWIFQSLQSQRPNELRIG